MDEFLPRGSVQYMYKGPIVGTNVSAENASTVGTIISLDDSADPGGLMADPGD